MFTITLTVMIAGVTAITMTIRVKRSRRRK